MHHDSSDGSPYVTLLLPPVATMLGVLYLAYLPPVIPPVWLLPKPKRSVKSTIPKEKMRFVLNYFGSNPDAVSQLLCGPRPAWYFIPTYVHVYFFNQNVTYFCFFRRTVRDPGVPTQPNQ